MAWLYVALVTGYVAWLQTAHAGIVFQEWFSKDRSGLILGPFATSCIFLLTWHFYAALQGLLDSMLDLPIARHWRALKLSRKDQLTYGDMICQVVLNQFQIPACLLGLWYCRLHLNTFHPPPSVAQFLWQMFMQYLIYEALFYSSHRLLHTRMLYPLHAKHHETQGSTGVSGQYQSFGDFLLTTTIPLAVGIVLVQPHVSVLWCVALIGSLNSVHSHGGYRFPGFPAPDDHALHHQNYRVNFGTGPLDWLLGTLAQTNHRKS